MFQIMFEHDKSCSACSASWCSEHVQRRWTCFEHDSRNCMFKTCSGATCDVQIMFGHVQHVQSMFKSSWTWKSWTWFSCSRTCFSCSGTWQNMLKHDCHVWNMHIMLRTWQSCSEHDIHVPNMTVMFQHVLSCSRTWKACSGAWKSCSGFSCSGWLEHALNMLNMTEHD